MGFMDDLANKAGASGMGGGGSHASLATALLSMLSSRGGGLSGLIQQFSSKGLGNIANSWVSTGRNLPISPDQVQTALGPDQVQTIASKAGVSPDEAKSGLAQVLPQVVDQLTPNGQMPQGDLMSKGMELLKGKFF